MKSTNVNHAENQSWMNSEKIKEKNLCLPHRIQKQICPKLKFFHKDITYIINRVVRPYCCLKFYKKSEAEKFFPPKFVFENIS